MNHNLESISESSKDFANKFISLFFENRKIIRNTNDSNLTIYKIIYNLRKDENNSQPIEGDLLQTMDFDDFLKLDPLIECEKEDLSIFILKVWFFESKKTRNIFLNLENSQKKIYLERIFNSVFETSPSAAKLTLESFIERGLDCLKRWHEITNNQPFKHVNIKKTKYYIKLILAPVMIAYVICFFYGLYKANSEKRINIDQKIESYYNSNTSSWDDFKRMVTPAMNLLGLGFSYGPTEKDYNSNWEYENSIRLGLSTRDGFWGIFTNTFLYSMYPFGKLLFWLIIFSPILFWVFKNKKKLLHNDLSIYLLIVILIMLIIIFSSI